MKTRYHLYRHFWYFIKRVGSAVLLFTTFAGSLRADPIADLRSVSIFKNADLSKMADGDILADRGSGSGRGQAIQSAFVVKASLARTANAQQQFNPARHSELRTYIQQDIGNRPGAQDFARLATAPSNSSVKSWISATESLPDNASQLLLNRADTKLYAASQGEKSGTPKAVVAFWTRVLSSRAESFAGGGLGSLPPYDTQGNAVRAADELNRLLKADAKVRNHFSTIIGNTPLGGGRGTIAPSLYWLLFDADDTAAVSLGASYGTNVSDGWQGADLQYYASGGLYAAVTLFQMWPVNLSGQNATLVWRVDLISSPNLGELKGVEKLGSGSALMREVQQNVRAFVKDVGSGR